MLAIAGGAVASIMLIYQAGLAGFQSRAVLAFGDLEANPNELGASLLLPFSLAFASFLSAGGAAKKAIPLVAMTLIAAAVFLTMSRGALVALVIAVMVLLYRVGLRTRVLVSLAVLALPLLFVPNLFFERIKEAPFGRGTGRLDIFLAGVQIVKHNPILGTGVANFPLAYRRYAGYAPVFRGYDTGGGWSAHNAYLQAWAETGVIGFVLLLLAIKSQMKAARAALGNPVSRDYRGIGIEAACWGALVYGLGGYIEWAKFFWLILILLTLIMRLQQRQQQLIFNSETLSYL
jgi:O-antigen ligase